MNDKEQSKRQFDILVDINRDFKKRARRINKVRRAIIDKEDLTLDSQKRRKAFVARELSKTRQDMQEEQEAGAVIDDMPRAVIHEDEFPESAIMEEAVIENTLERLIGNTNDILSIETLEHGMAAARAVGLLEVGMITGTAFLVGQDLIMTSAHNFMDRADAKRAKFVLDFEDNDVGEVRRRKEFDVDADRFFFSSEDHDFALVAVKPETFDGAKLADYKPHRLFEEEGKIIIGRAVNVIHHASGERKKISMHNARLEEIQNEMDGEQFCYYTADTLKGSSGAPVFNHHWEVIGLHRRGVPNISADGKVELINGAFIDREDLPRHDKDIRWLSNQGVRVSRIIKVLKSAQIDVDAEQTILTDLLRSWGVDIDLIA